jgi:hypothetical protein
MFGEDDRGRTGGGRRSVQCTRAISGGQSERFWAILMSILTTILMSILELVCIIIV